MHNEDVYLHHRVIIKIDNRIRSVSERILFYNFWLTVFVAVTFITFTASLFISNDLLAGRYYWLIDLAIISLWTQLLLIGAYVFRVAWFLYRRARSGISPKSSDIDSGTDIWIQYINGNSVSKSGIYLSSVVSITYIVSGLIGILILDYIWSRLNELALIIGNLEIRQSFFRSSLNIVRPGLAGLFDLLGAGDLMLIVFIIIAILLLSVVFRGFESLYMGSKRQSAIRDKRRNTGVKNELTALLHIMKSIFKNMLFGELRRSTSIFIVYLIWGITASIPSIYFLYLFFTS